MEPRLTSLDIALMPFRMYVEEHIPEGVSLFDILRFAEKKGADLYSGGPSDLVIVPSYGLKQWVSDKYTMQPRIIIKGTQIKYSFTDFPTGPFWDDLLAYLGKQREVILDLPEPAHEIRTDDVQGQWIYFIKELDLNNPNLKITFRSDIYSWIEGKIEMMQKLLDEWTPSRMETLKKRIKLKY